MLHAPWLFMGQPDKLIAHDGSIVLKPYLTFVRDEWNSPMLTEIFLESTRDQDQQKACIEPLFEKSWAGI